MKLRSKINLYTTVMFICLLLLINGAIYVSFSRVTLNSELERTAAEAKQTIKGIQSGTTIPTKDLLRAYAPTNGMLQIVNADGSTDAAATAPGHQKLRQEPVTFYQKEQREIIEYDGIPHAFISLPIIWTGGEVADLQVTENLALAANNLKVLKFVLIAVTLLAAIPLFLSSRLLSNFITRPISSMMKTMQAIRGSGQHKRIVLPKQSKDELYQMGETFNEMMAQLEMNYEKQEQFVSNASHELKTPLTVIEAYASLLKRRGRDNPEVFDESVDAIQSEASRMKDLTQQLLLLAKHEQWNIEMSNVPLAELVEESIRSFRAGYKREIKLVVEHKSIVRADQQKLKQLIYILMDNAHKYSDASIRVNVRTVQNKALIEIIDQGVGIPTSDLAHVFDRFFRVDTARTRKSGGFGLGLSLAKEIADLMDAEIRIDSVEGKGTTAQIWINIADSH